VHHIGAHGEDARKFPSQLNRAALPSVKIKDILKDKKIYLKDIGKYVFLHDRVVNPDRSAADLHPIQNQVIMLSPNL